MKLGALAPEGVWPLSQSDDGAGTVTWLAVAAPTYSTDAPDQPAVVIDADLPPGAFARWIASLSASRVGSSQRCASSCSVRR